MHRTVLVSNRVMDLTKAAQAGGVTVAIADVLRARKGMWFGWDGKISKESEGALPDVNVVDGQGGATIATVPLNASEYKDYYLGYANSVLWPVFHARLDLAQFEAGFYRRYLDVNRRFAQALKPLLRPDDVIWVHDYHLIPLGGELRKLGVENAVGFFLHIPMPPAQMFLAIPEHKDLARALSAYDLIGLQTRADVANLIDFLEDGVFGRILQDGRIGVFDRELSIASFPVGIDFNDFAGGRPLKAFLREPAAAPRIIGIDRLDYTKGLPQKFRAFGRFLEKYPAYRRKVILSQIAPPTRESVEAYSDIRQELETLSGRINGKFGELDWVPIQYIHRPTPRKKLTEIYRSSRIGFVTPLRDGMNLVAKEYVAAQDPADPGVLVLSRFAGAAEQLKEALVVNPYDVEEMADALKAAIEMDLGERQDRHQALLASVRTNDTFAWCRSFLNALENIRVRERRAAGSRSADTVRRALRHFDQGSARPRTHSG